MAGNPFDQFDAAAANPFDQFDQPAQRAAANPFNRQVGSDVSYGAPLGPAPPPAGQTDLSGEARAAMGGWSTDRMASAFQTYAPAILGGTGQDYGTNLAVNRRETGEAQAAHPANAMAGNIAGVVPYAMLAPEGILGAAGAGAVSGAADSPDWSNIGQTATDPAKGTALGLGIGTAGKVIGAGLGKLAPAAVDASVPTAETIGPMKNAAYNLGVAYTPEAFAGLVNKITADARDANIDPDLHKGAASVISNLQRTADSGEPITLTQLDQKRQLVGRDAAGTPADKYFGNQIRGNIDDFIQNAGPDQMASGTGPDAAAAIQNARDLNTRFAKSEALNEQLEHAKDLAGGSGSGANLDNAMRQAMRRTQDSQGGWSPDEAALLQQGIRGGTGQNFLRATGNKLAPSGLIGGLELLSGTTGAVGGAYPTARSGPHWAPQPPPP